MRIKQNSGHLAKKVRKKEQSNFHYSQRGDKVIHKNEVMRKIVIVFTFDINYLNTT